MAQDLGNTYAADGSVTIPRRYFDNLLRDSDTLRVIKRYFDNIQLEPLLAPQSASSSGTAVELPAITRPATSITSSVETVSSAPLGLPPGIYIPSIPLGATLQDLVSVIKGGAIISIHTVNMKREGKTTTRGYLLMKSGAKDFIDWTRLNPVFLHGKKVTFIWSNDKANMKPAIDQAVAAGATRNIIIHGIGEKGITHEMLQEDVANLPWTGTNVISTIIKSGDAYFSTNSIQSAIRLREAILTHHNYIGCTASYYPDECDRSVTSKPDLLIPRKQEEDNVLLDLVEMEKKFQDCKIATLAGLQATSSASSSLETNEDEGVDLI